MSVWVLIQILMNLFFIASTVILWIRLKREPSEDPRLSRALQLVTSKIAVLEDLSKQTDTQSEQINALIEQKSKMLLEQIERSDAQLAKIERAQQKSLDVAQIFQDKIPHEEIIQRQMTMKYIEAARLAHEGKSLEEIQSVVDLSYAELELITKLNRDQMIHDEGQVKEWVESGVVKPVETASNADLKLKALGEKFSKLPSIEEIQSKSFKKISPAEFRRL